MFRRTFTRSFSVKTLRTSFGKSVVPSYGRFDIALSHGEGSYVFDTDGKKYLDMGTGIAVSCLGHGHPRIVQTISDQAKKLMHCSNLYYFEEQSVLADALVSRLGPGKVFFANSGAEANEGMYKLARKFGNQSDSDANRYEIITTTNSFHGRTLGGIAATGQEKIKKGFYPMTPGFKHVPYNDLEAMKEAVGDNTAAIMIEGIQGEGGILCATPEYLLGLRKLCDERNMLLMMDGVQCGHYRTGYFQSYQQILSGCNLPGAHTFTPDVVSMAKSLGGGFPIGAMWVREHVQDTLQAGYHGTTYGGNPLACAVAKTVLDVIEEEKLDDNIKEIGKFIKGSLLDLQMLFPSLILGVRGEGFMLGLNLAFRCYANEEGEKPTALRFVEDLHAEGMLTVPSGNSIVRILPPYNITQAEAEECIEHIQTVITRRAESSSKKKSRRSASLPQGFGSI